MSNEKQIIKRSSSMQLLFFLMDIPPTSRRKVKARKRKWRSKTGAFVFFQVTPSSCFTNSIISRSTKKNNIEAVARPSTESLISTSAVQSEKLCKIFALGWVAERSQYGISLTTQARSLKNTRETSNMDLLHVILHYAIPNGQVRFYKSFQTIFDKYNIETLP